MKVRDVMILNPITIAPFTIVTEAAKLMRDNKIGSVIVVDKGKVIGIVTERDLIRRVLAEDRNPKTVKISEVMSSPVISISQEEDIIEAAQFMKIKGIRRLTVMDKEKLIGIVTTDDLIGNMKRAAEEFATSLYLMARGEKKALQASQI